MATSQRTLQVHLPDARSTDAMGCRLADASAGQGLVVYLEGDLGSGKTALARAWLKRLGAGERIKSPTYSLVEPYILADGQPAWHLDLYRIGDPTELEWLGLDALADPAGLVLVEWPGRGRGALPPPDLTCEWTLAGEGRDLCIRAGSARGCRVLEQLSD